MVKVYISLIFLNLFNSNLAIAKNIYSELTDGRCTTLECMNRVTINELTGGKCTTVDCMNRETLLELSGKSATTFPVIVLCTLVLLLAVEV